MMTMFGVEDASSAIKGMENETTMNAAKEITGRQGRQPGTDRRLVGCFRTGVANRSRWSLNFVKNFPVFDIGTTACLTVMNALVAV